MDLRLGDLAFGVELVVGGAQSLGERVVGVAVLGLAQEVGLPAGQVVGLLVEPAAFGVAFLGGAVVVAGHVRGEQGDPAAAEDPFGVEVGDRGFEDVLADADGLGMPVELVVAASVGGAGPADVPDGCAGFADVAEHPPPTGAVDHPPEHICSFARGMAVQRVGLA
ncbi:hypothetical protein [Pseudofrankia sp. DC12]|uniref:hypothetical protein n=1 Tax=Pseudofrankia sp. DC12 TaxID=683315 RepID=UPI0012F8D0B5|nr:hypothetical protein [Pseudofrankia sp. DC12]